MEKYIKPTLSDHSIETADLLSDSGKFTVNGSRGADANDSFSRGFNDTDSWD